MSARSEPKRSRTAKPVAGKKALRVINDGDEDVSLDALSRHPKNPRKGNVNAIGRSIKENGFYGRIVVQRDTNYVLAGNHRFEAAKAAGADSIPVTWVRCNDKQALKILAVDNRTSDIAGYDEAALADILGQFQTEGDLLGTGYDDSDVTALLDSLAGIAPPDTDAATGITVAPDGADPEAVAALPEPEDVPADHIDNVVAAHTQLGDVWTIAGHRIVCGDSTDPEAYRLLLDGERVDLSFTSPPYNVGVGYNEHNDSGDFNGYMTMLQGIRDRVVENMNRGRVFAWNIPQSAPSRFWEQIAMLLDGDALRYLRTFVWSKGGPSFPQWHFAEGNPVARHMRADPLYEFVFLFATGKDLEHGAPIKLDETIRGDIFMVRPSTPGMPAGDTTTGRPGGSSLGMRKTAHPATFPIKLPLPFINNLTSPGENVFDPFLGSGTTILAAHRLGRRGFGIDMSPRYVDLAMWRLQKEIGELPKRNGETHDFVK